MERGPGLGITPGAAGARTGGETRRRTTPLPSWMELAVQAAGTGDQKAQVVGVIGTVGEGTRAWIPAAEGRAPRARARAYACG